MEIKRHGEVIDTITPTLTLGDQFPAFEVMNKDNQTVKSSTLVGQQLTLFSNVPDINTRVCSIQTKKFNEDVDKAPSVQFITISTNTPAQQSDWCAAENVKKMLMLADTTGSYGHALGIYVNANQTLARSIFIVNEQGELVYQEILSEQVNEPDYAAALNFLQQ